jgi:hypothetical protein
VDKYILTAIAPDEAVTFLVIEPLDHTFHNGTAHCNSLHVLLLLGGHYEKGWWMSIGTQPSSLCLSSLCLSSVLFGVHRTTCGFPETVLRV